MREQNPGYSGFRDRDDKKFQILSRSMIIIVIPAKHIFKKVTLFFTNVKVICYHDG